MLHTTMLNPIRLLRSALPTAILMLVFTSVAESVMAQTPPNYVCYFRRPNGEVVNLSSICGDDEAEATETAAGSLSIRDVQVTDAGLTGVVVNESDQPVRINNLGFELTQADGRAVLVGTAVPVTDVLLPNEPVQFIADFSGEERDQLAVYADVDLELAIAPDSITPVVLDDSISGEVENSTSGEVEDFPRGDENIDTDGLDADGLGNDGLDDTDDDTFEDIEDFPLGEEILDADGVENNELDDPVDATDDGTLDGVNDDEFDATSDDDTFDAGNDNGFDPTGDINNEESFDAIEE